MGAEIGCSLRWSDVVTPAVDVMFTRALTMSMNHREQLASNYGLENGSARPQEALSIGIWICRVHVRADGRSANDGSTLGAL